MYKFVNEEDDDGGQLFLVAKQFLIANFLKAHFNVVKQDDVNSSALCFSLILAIENRMRKRCAPRVEETSNDGKRKKAICPAATGQSACSVPRVEETLKDAKRQKVICSTKTDQSAIANKICKRFAAEILQSALRTENSINELLEQKKRHEDLDEKKETCTAETGQSALGSKTSTNELVEENKSDEDVDEKKETCATSESVSEETQSQNICDTREQETPVPRNTSDNVNCHDLDDEPEVIRAMITLLEYQLKKALRKRGLDS